MWDSGEVGSIHAATKGAINQLSKSLACEWGKDNIRINSVAPWFFKTLTAESFQTPAAAMGVDDFFNPHGDFDPEPDPESGSSFDDPDPDPDYDDDDPDPDYDDDDPDLDSEDDPDPQSDDDPNPEFVSDSDPDPDFDFDSGPD
ncbi:hypothetical protein L3X38_030957 [Prunus dulcis]|uniref:NAD(P)-binding Rossmann-fold superfamily protein n=1 Tax=Prunus dulcis TaxID=3755 RepID=A0AAD4VBA8_PRUDU|nr:hypothetical protein L3X38_030957 [Prunus dulcis]